MPGRGWFSRLAVASGGPRGCLHRSKVSMTIMPPPQQGAWRAEVVGFVGATGVRRRGDVQEFAGERKAGLAGRAGQQAVGGGCGGSRAAGHGSESDG